MAAVLAKENVNRGRQLEVDLARAFAIFTMVLVHVYEKLDLGESMGTALRVVIEFLGGPTSAPVFMTAMGIGIVYSKNQDAFLFITRGKQLVAQGYRLNLLRGGLVILVVYTLTADEAWLTTVVEYMLVLDILHFAGMAFLVFALLKRLGAKPWHILALGVLGQVVAALVEPVAADSMLPAGILGYFLFQNANTCFPLASWFLYPAAGYCFALLLRRVENKTGFYARLLAGCAGLLAACTALLVAVGYDVGDIFLTVEYYRQGPVRAFWILLVCGVLYSLLYFVSLALGAGPLRRLAAFMSNHVNDIYMNQWVLIMWSCVFVFSNMQITTPGFFAIVAGTLVLSVLLAYAKKQSLPLREKCREWWRNSH